MKTGTPLIILPLEPLDERYTASWYRNFPKEFSAAGFDVTTIDGTTLVDNDIKVGSFLDINSTVVYKSTQLQQVAQMFNTGQIKNGTVFFISDIEFWGIEVIRLLADMNKVQIKMAGFLHAASYTHEDAFAIATPYQRYTEVGWVAAMDLVFVGSAYHKQAVIERRLRPLHAEHLESRIIVTKNPIFLDDYPLIPVEKKKKVLLTNRFDEEKRPNDTLRLFADLKGQFPDWEFVVTTGRKTFRGSADTTYALELEQRGVITIKAGLTKQQYHTELAESMVMVSHSIEEMYGYCIAEALIYNVLPVLTRGLSHDEFVPAGLTFESAGEALHLTRRIIRDINIGECEPVPTLDTSGMANITNALIGLAT